MTTDDKPSARAVQTTFSAMRVRRNLLRRSSVGVIATGRSPGASGGDGNGAAGVDADFRFFDNVQATAYWARTRAVANPAPETADLVAATAALVRRAVEAAARRYGERVERLVIGPQFNPEVGFVRRGDVAITSASGRFSPRFRPGSFVRKLSWQADLDYITDAAGAVLEDRAATAQFGVEFNSGETMNVSATRQYELLPSDFTIAPGVIVPAGGYRYDSLNASYNLAAKRLVSGNVSASYGSFYDGMRFLVSPTARLGFSSLTQFNPSADTLTFSVRTRWEYSPGSDLYVVYSDGRDTASRLGSSLQTRSFAIKATRLLRF
jgi:hypothetical protein